MSKGPRRVLRHLLVAITALAAGAFIAPAAASADSPTCPDFGYLCVWTGSHQTGSRSRFYYSNSSWSGAVVQNNDRSWQNDGTQPVRVYDYWQGPQTLCISPGTTVVQWIASEAKGDANVWTASQPC